MQGTRRGSAKGGIVAAASGILVLLLVGTFLFYPSFYQDYFPYSISQPILQAHDSLAQAFEGALQSSSGGGQNPASSTGSTSQDHTSSVSSQSSSSQTFTSGPPLPNPSFVDGKANIAYPPDYSTLSNFALNLINTDRRSNGLGNVSLSQIPSGQQHADSMVFYGYFSHWDVQGYKPYMRYTLLGGTGAISENVAMGSCTTSPLNSTLVRVEPCSIGTIEKGIAVGEWGMMNDDMKCCNNGHRDNILDPLHNRVSIGIAYDSKSSALYFVEDFEDSYLTMKGPIVGSGGGIDIQASLAKSLDVSQLTVFYDPLPKAMTIAELDNTSEYGPGSFAGGVFPPCSFSCPYYPSAVTVYASQWRVSPTGVAIQFSLHDFEKTDGPGVYTIYLQTGDNTSTAIMTYSFFFQS